MRIKENSWLAKLAAKKLGSPVVAMVIGKTIHLYNVSIGDFVRDKRWLIHELKHVEQFHNAGTIPFLWSYFIDFLKNGYYKNKYEVEARAAETDESLLKKYDISQYLKKPA